MDPWATGFCGYLCLINKKIHITSTYQSTATAKNEHNPVFAPKTNPLDWTLSALLKANDFRSLEKNRTLPITTLPLYRPILYIHREEDVGESYIRGWVVYQNRNIHFDMLNPRVGDILTLMVKRNLPEERQILSLSRIAKKQFR